MSSAVIFKILKHFDSFVRVFLSFDIALNKSKALLVTAFN